MTGERAWWRSANTACAGKRQMREAFNLAGQDWVWENHERRAQRYSWTGIPDTCDEHTALPGAGRRQDQRTCAPKRAQ